MVSFMKLANFSSDEFVDQTVLNSAETLTRDSLLDITGGLHTAGLIGASNLSFSYSGLNVTVNAPLPFMALFSDGTLASANGTTDGESSSSATVDFSSLVPSTGSITAYLVATSGSVAQEAFSVVGPPVGHPDFNSNFSPYTAYAEEQDTLIFSATTTAPDNTDTLLICSTVLSAGQTTITTSSTSGQVRAGAILSRNGEVLAADLGSGAAASNVGTLGGSLVGTLPNPTLAATGATSGTYINPVTITVDEDGRVSNIANVSNWNVPGNVTAGGTIVASGTATAAAATSPANLIPYGQAFQLLQPTASESITLGNTLHTVVQPSSGITADITLTLEPGSVQGQEVTCYGAGSTSGSVTYQSNVTTGSPYFYYPDFSTNYSWTVPTNSPVQGIKLVWDGTNWRARTFGQTVVGAATADNEAVNLGQLFIGNRKSVFTANGTFTVPSAVTTIWVSGCGGGGGGGGGNVLSLSAQGGGGGGGYPGSIAIKKSIAVTPGEVLTITVGAAGAGGAGTSSLANAGNGTAGGSSIVSSGTTNLITLGGGSGGSGATAYSTTAVFGGAGYTIGLAVFSITGSTTTPDGGGNIGYGGAGGSGPFGCGGGGSSGGGSGGSGSGSGSGGGGGGGSGGSGGNGSSGIIIIEW